MKKLLIPLVLLLAATVLLLTVTASTFTSVEEARTYVENYVSPYTYGTATIQSIETILDSNEYKITYLLEYTEGSENKTEYVTMYLYNELPSDKVIEIKLNEHAINFFNDIIDKRPELIITFQREIIGKKIEIKKVNTEMIVTDELIK